MIKIINKRGLSILLCLSILFMFFSVSTVYAQNEFELSGTVVSATDNQSIPGVNIFVEGLGGGTVTDLDGHYSVKVKTGDVLRVSFIGFVTQEITVTDQSVLDITLEEDVAEFEELVVVGYGVQKKKLVTGATAQVKGDALEKRKSTSPMMALQGQAAGVNITSTSGQPGEGMKVVIRGVGTIGNSDPLYIVDGVQMDNIDYLNSADIESVDVLKDAASAAIYGSQAANGVVLVTTKSGQTGKSQVTFDAYYGVQNRAKKIELCNAREYAELMNEQHLNSGNSASSMPFDVNDLPAYTGDKTKNADTDWLDELFVDNAKTQNYNLGVTGGNDQTVYSMSLSYTGQEGIVGGSDYSNYERYNGRFNSEKFLFDKRVRVGEHLVFTYVKKNGIGVGDQYDNSLRGAYNTSPLLPMYDDNGDFFNTNSDDIVDQNGEEYWTNTESNPYAEMVYSNQNTTDNQRLVGDVYAEIDILKDLTFKTTLGINYYSDNERSYTPEYELSIYSSQLYDKVSQKMSKNLAWNVDNVLTYGKELGESSIKAMAGMSIRASSGTWMYGENVESAFDDLDHAYLDNATNTDNAATMSLEGGPNDESKMLSYFGRIEYNWRETYMFNAVLRADGSSNFAEDNRWGIFPSVSAGWVITNENFASNISHHVDFFKLRASWGQNGNQNIGTFQYTAPISFTNAQYAFGSTEGTSETGSYQSRLANTDVKWETSEQIDVGFDSYLFNRKLGINFDWYYKKTKDWLIVAPVLATAGTDAPYINGGDVLNTGIELMLSYNNHIGDLNYSIQANGTYNKNIVGEIPSEDGIIHGSTNMLYNNSEEFYRAEDGYPVGYFWGYETDGIFQNTSEVQSYTNSDGDVIQPKAEPGDFRYVDINDDGNIDEDDKTNLGDPNPDFLYGLSASLQYKAIDFSIVTNGVAGNQIVQSYRSHSSKYSNYLKEVYDNRWNGEGSSNTIPRVTNSNINYQFSDTFVKNGSYLRISNITIGYDLSKKINTEIIKRCRIYAQVQNVYTFTKYTGMDPEIGYGFDNGDDDKFSSGIDLGYYPRPRTMLVGVSLTF